MDASGWTKIVASVDKRHLEVSVWSVHNFRLLSVFEFLGGCKRPAGFYTRYLYGVFIVSACFLFLSFRGRKMMDEDRRAEGGTKISASGITIF